MALRHRDQRWQGDGAAMEHAVAMHVVELETLHLRAVDQRRMGRRQLLPRPPHRGRARGVEAAKCILEDAAPWQVGAIEAAAERVEDQQLDALAHLLRNALAA